MNALIAVLVFILLVTIIAIIYLLAVIATSLERIAKRTAEGVDRKLREELENCRSYAQILGENLSTILAAVKFLDDGHGPNTTTALAIKAAEEVKRQQALIAHLEKELSIAGDQIAEPLACLRWCVFHAESLASIAHVNGILNGEAFYQAVLAEIEKRMQDEKRSTGLER